MLCEERALETSLNGKRATLRGSASHINLYRAMKLRIAAAIVLVVLIIGTLAGIKTLQIRKMIAGGRIDAAPDRDGIDSNRKGGTLAEHPVSHRFCNRCTRRDRYSRHPGHRGGNCL